MTTPLRDNREAIKAAVKALLNYEQADEDGIMVLTSRQAIHEVADALEAAENIDRQRREQIDRLQNTIQSYQEKSSEALSGDRVVVEREPTESMIEAGAQVLFGLPGFFDPPATARKIVTDILAAANHIEAAKIS